MKVHGGAGAERQVDLQPEIFALHEEVEQVAIGVGAVIDEGADRVEADGFEVGQVAADDFLAIGPLRPSRIRRLPGPRRPCRKRACS